ncbi:MAG: beta-N-acetylhexosaminidase, partial [Candidatus Neomarinimicrobiota bacterium]|nr:beta-N-acetylhexosaminidase [Candidatus Neomarinimicrobiota bacterium]
MNISTLRKNFRKNGLVFVLSLFIWSCSSTRDEGGQEQTLGLVPLPQKIEVRNGSFQFGQETTILLDATVPEAKYVIDYLSDHLKKRYDVELRRTESSGQLHFKLTGESEDLEEEDYRLEVSSSGISLSAANPAGLFYGSVTLLQLLDEGERLGRSGSVPAVKITDSPRFSWRGMHLDVGRHFFPVDFVKRYIDLIAMHKMNRFHWHLTEDHGWRIEIKKYPKLTEIGAWRSESLVGHYTDEPRRYDGIRYGGFYTQDEIREVVEYAAERFITVVPEIEMPGHSVAALAAYPELACTDGPFEVEKLWGVHDDVYCAGKEVTFEFLQDVLTEVMALFPSTYIHIGGDECPKTRWKAHDLDQKRMKEENLKDEHELQSYFVKRIERFLSSHDRRLVGWDEILEGGLPPAATVMSWRGYQGGIEAANSGHDVIMTPTSYCYFDYYQSKDKESEPLAIGGFLPLSKVYQFEPIPPEIDPEKAHHILGGQGNVWTEYIKTEDQVEYMAM